METKSRYEVIAELEEKKRQFIIERDSFDLRINQKEKQIKLKKREIEDMEEDLEEFEGKVEENKTTLTELISSIDDSLKRFESQSQKK